jgi:site-specific DNA recombinase
MIDLVALIYTRVSSISQKTQGSGNESQEIRCREHAKHNGWSVEKVFEDAFTGSGDFMNRPAMRELITYVKKHKNKNFVVIFDDIKRLSRDTVAFIRLTALFSELGVKLECLNHKFEDTPEGEFITTILAAQGQLERKQNARQVIQKTEAHLLNGDWPYKAPIGYIGVQIPGNKRKIYSIDGEAGKGIQAGLIGFVTGRFKTASELARYFADNHYIRNTTRNGMHDKTRSILLNPFYAGYIHKPEKGAVMIKGKHEGMISLEDYYTIRKRLIREDSGEKQYQMFREEFELRQLVRCAGCGKKLKSGRSKGRTKYYNYYTCRNKECEMDNVNIQSHVVHEELYKTLRSIESSEEVIELGIQAFNEALEEVVKMKNLREVDIAKAIEDIDSQIDVLVSTMVKVTTESVIRSLESKIEELDIKKKVLIDKKDKIITLDNKSRTALNEMKEFLKSPYKTWSLCNAKQKRTLYRFIFADDFVYDPKTKSRTIPLSSIYSYFQDINRNTIPCGDGISDHHYDGARSWSRTRDLSSISRML